MILPGRRTTAGSVRQRGMSKWTLLVFLMLLAGAGTAVLKIAPHYIDFRIVKSVADRLPKDTVHGEMSRSDIEEHFQKQFRIENFRLPVRDVLKVERDREKTMLNIAYEVREHLFFNVDVVLTFNDVRTFQ